MQLLNGIYENRKGLLSMIDFVNLALLLGSLAAQPQQAPATGIIAVGNDQACHAIKGHENIVSSIGGLPPSLVFDEATICPSSADNMNVVMATTQPQRDSRGYCYYEYVSIVVADKKTAATSLITHRMYTLMVHKDKFMSDNCPAHENPGYVIVNGFSKAYIGAAFGYLNMATAIFTDAGVNGFKANTESENLRRALAHAKNVSYSGITLSKKMALITMVVENESQTSKWYIAFTTNQIPAELSYIKRAI